MHDAQWRGAVAVTVMPEDGSEAFNSTAYRTLTAKWSEEREFEEQVR